MRTTLLVTTAVAAVLGCSTLVMAQQNGAAEGQMGKGATQQQGSQSSKGTPSGAKSEPQRGSDKAPGKSAQDEPSQQGPSGQRSNSGKETQEHNGQGQVGQGSQPRGQETNHAQGEERNRGEPQRGAEKSEGGKSGKNSAQSETGKSGKNSAQDESGKSGSSRERTGENNNRKGGASVKLSQEQRTKIKDIVVQRHTARVSHPNFSVKIGTTIPHNVHLVVLPEDIVTLVPEYRGFDYILVGEDILIVDPDSLRIVAVIPA
jgi:hypothetical protein